MRNIIKIIMLSVCMMAILCSCKNEQKTETAETKDVVYEEINKAPQITFPEQTILAVAVVPNEMEVTFAQKYFPNGGYDDMKTIDTGKEMRFVVISKDENVKFSVFPCDINDEGEVVKSEAAYIENYSGCLKINAMEVEYIPHVCIVYESNGIEKMLPLTFEGQEGHIDLSGNENDVIDISIY